MELQSLANIIQGNIPTRIEVTTGQSIETITMQELNYIVNVSDDLPIAKYITVQGDKIGTYSLTKEYDVVVGLSSGKAIVIESNRADKLILSNLAIIRINDMSEVDPYYLCWFINNNTAALKQLKKLKQATTAVSIIPLSIKRLDKRYVFKSIRRESISFSLFNRFSIACNVFTNTKILE